MIRKFAIVVVAAIALAAPALAQEREEQAKPAESKSPPTPESLAAPRRDLGQAINVRIDVTITDQTAAGEPALKTLTLLAADNSWSRIRSEGMAFTSAGGGQSNITLRLDARPRILQADKLHLEMIVEYKPTVLEAKQGSSATTLSESFDVVLENGKPLLISQSADPNTDRKVKLEVKATILR